MLHWETQQNYLIWLVCSIDNSGKNAPLIINYKAHEIHLNISKIDHFKLKTQNFH